ncbi:hypothetical protein CQ052_14240 [Ochrobactrum sp. MYb15]|nr:hypothetical protein CWE02_02685 [Brucella pituitosa]PQZ50412.1 hypothetical protein CQZ90_07365 [Ochrobactrum sp. MYb19]PRA55375.1 hypothetical protein CQ062_10900 [Ochrobactrum sp. MYb68]PRA68451.1 hypothetical protein CQ053_02355 [Ochrobactrum sp. MYb18]PRA74321.1 hypothetical protein CQ049_13725 [Brucella thiophenivorans]PRA86422.1 hypothetical protein CQ054_09330 [Ochrobactrum sp. MYb29]PRA90703.1 hypothetical protein CQ051_12260 [Ochrobactrum sp. MYb14]PRA96154.1 hypothetical protei
MIPVHKTQALYSQTKRLQKCHQSTLATLLPSNLLTKDYRTKLNPKFTKGLNAIERKSGD